MRQFYYIILLILVISGCSNKNNEQTYDFLKDPKVAIVNDTTFLKWLVSLPVETWEPVSKDWKEIDNVLHQAECDSIFNFMKAPRLKNIRNYFYRQYVFYKNDKGQKVVYINAFCELLQFPTEIDNETVWTEWDWKNQIVFVEDGGDCFWQIKINLDEQKYFDFRINGV